MKKLVCMVFAFLISALVSSAQDIPRGDVAAGVSDLYIIKGYTINMVGPSGAFTANANNWLGVVGDFGVYFGHIPQSFSGELYTFGPRFYLRKPGSRFVPFGQALFGGSHFSTSTGGISGGPGVFLVYEPVDQREQKAYPLCRYLAEFLKSNSDYTSPLPDSAHCARFEIR